MSKGKSGKAGSWSLADPWGEAPAPAKGGAKGGGWSLADPWGGKGGGPSKGGGKKGAAWAAAPDPYDPWAAAEEAEEEQVEETWEEEDQYGPPAGPPSGKGAAKGGAKGGASITPPRAASITPAKGARIAPSVAASKGGAYVGGGGKAAAPAGGGKGAGAGGGKAAAFGGGGGGKAAGWASAGADRGGYGGAATEPMGYGGGKGPGKSEKDMKPASEGMLYPAISEAVESLSQLETEWDAQVLEKKLRGYFNKGSKNMNFKGKLNDLINEYADNVMSSVVAGFGDREWLYSGQVDFVLVLDAAIKDSFPGFLLRGCKQEDFEQLVLAAYERAFDEQRFFPLLSEAVAAHVTGPKTKKKVWNAVDQARKKTVAEGIANVDDFTHTWISTSIALLDEASQGGLEGCLTSADAAQFFTVLLEQGGLPAVLTQEGQAPVGMVADVVSGSYAEYCGEAGAPAAKKMKGALANWGLPDYGGKGASFYSGARGKDAAE